MANEDEAICVQKGFSGLQVTVLHQGSRGTQGRNLEVGMEVEVTEGYALLTCFPRLVQPAVLHNPESLALGQYHPQWAESFQINHQSRKYPLDIPTDQSDEGSLSRGIDAFPSQDTLVCVELITTNQRCIKREFLVNVMYFMHTFLLKKNLAVQIPECI